MVHGRLAGPKENPRVIVEADAYVRSRGCGQHMAHLWTVGSTLGTLQFEASSKQHPGRGVHYLPVSCRMTEDRDTAQGREVRRGTQHDAGSRLSQCQGRLP